ncbi:MAG: group III truncated hemoglobin [Pseudomonadota bacterium]
MEPCVEPGCAGAGRPDKSGITRSDISTVVAAFYAEVRKDALLGPIFHRHIGQTDADWAPHIRKIEAFWANIMLKARDYQGNPMQVHLGVPEIGPGHFVRWLDVFEATVSEVLPAGKAQAFDTIARRIGRSLQMGLENARSAGPPLLKVR